MASGWMDPREVVIDMGETVPALTPVIAPGHDDYCAAIEHYSVC